MHFNRKTIFAKFKFINLTSFINKFYTHTQALNNIVMQIHYAAEA